MHIYKCLLYNNGQYVLIWSCTKPADTILLLSKEGSFRKRFKWNMSPISRQWVLGSTSQYSQLIQWWIVKCRLESVGASSRESSTVDCGVKTLNKRASWFCSGFLSLSLGGLLYFCRSGQNMFEPIRSLGYIMDHITSLQRELTELKLRINLKICTTINISWFFIIQPVLYVHESNAGFGASKKADNVAYALTRLVLSAPAAS